MLTLLLTLNAESKLQLLVWMSAQQAKFLRVAFLMEFPLIVLGALQLFTSRLS
jgi:hypothetical protein